MNKNKKAHSWLVGQIPVRFIKNVNILKIGDYDQRLNQVATGTGARNWDSCFGQLSAMGLGTRP
jgi:hypothetical protein